MFTPLKKLAKYVAVLLGLLFVLFVVNQLYQLYVLTAAVHPWFGAVVTGAVAVAVVLAIALPVLYFLRLPKTLTPPDGTAQGQEAYQQQLARRLMANKHVKAAGIDWHQPDAMQQAVQVLDDKANESLQHTARSVFLTTAISQNGKLDAFVVLLTQARMVWQLAHIYQERPAFKDMWNLYINVGTSALLASQVEQINITEQIEPVVKSLVKSAAGKSIPVVGQAAHVIMDSIFEGSTNAFLTLRVGIITRQYCSSGGALTVKQMRKNALKEASMMLGSLVLALSGQVVKAVLGATKDAGVESIKTGAKAVGKAASSMANGISGWAGKINPFQKSKKAALTVTAITPLAPGQLAAHMSPAVADWWGATLQLPPQAEPLQATEG